MLEFNTLSRIVRSKYDPIRDVIDVSVLPKKKKRKDPNKQLELLMVYMHIQKLIFNYL